MVVVTRLCWERMPTATMLHPCPLLRKAGSIHHVFIFFQSFLPPALYFLFSLTRKRMGRIIHTDVSGHGTYTQLPV